MARLEQTEQSQTGKFLRIVDGNICDKSRTPREGFEEYRTINPSQKDDEGKPLEVVYYVKRYAGVSGKVVGLNRIEKEESQIFGYNLILRDEDGDFSIFFKDGSRTTNRLLKVLDNVDLSKDLVIKVWKDKEGKPAIAFSQEGENVPQRWTKENLPEPKKKAGKWDYSAQDDVLYNNTMEFIGKLPEYKPEGQDDIPF